MTTIGKAIIANVASTSLGPYVLHRAVSPKMNTVHAATLGFQNWPSLIGEILMCPKARVKPALCNVRFWPKAVYCAKNTSSVGNAAFPFRQSAR